MVTGKWAFETGMRYVYSLHYTQNCVTAAASITISSTKHEQVYGLEKRAQNGQAATEIQLEDRYNLFRISCGRPRERRRKTCRCIYREESGAWCACASASFELSNRLYYRKNAALYTGGLANNFYLHTLSLHAGYSLNRVTLPRNALVNSTCERSRHLFFFLLSSFLFPLPLSLAPRPFRQKQRLCVAQARSN